MKLSDFLSTLRTKNVTVTINDLQDNLVCKIDAASVSALADDLEARTVNRWEIAGATALKVILNEADNSNNSDPGNDPGNDPGTVSFFVSSLSGWYGVTAISPFQHLEKSRCFFYAINAEKRPNTKAERTADN